MYMTYRSNCCNTSRVGGGLAGNFHRIIACDLRVHSILNTLLCVHFIHLTQLPFELRDYSLDLPKLFLNSFCYKARVHLTVDLRQQALLLAQFLQDTVTSFRQDGIGSRERWYVPGDGSSVVITLKFLGI